MNAGTIKKIFCFSDTVFNFFMLKKCACSHGAKLRITGRLHIHGNGKLILGDGVTITSDEDKNPSEGSSRTHLSIYPGAVLSIGNRSGLSNSAVTAMERITIGDNVLIGSGCMITDTDFHSIRPEDRLNGDADIKHKPIVIENGAFIGARCIILKGVTIGENAVIGAGSVVTKDIPRNEVWAGNPAHFVKKV